MLIYICGALMHRHCHSRLRFATPSRDPFVDRACGRSSRHRPTSRPAGDKDPIKDVVRQSMSADTREVMDR